MIRAHKIRLNPTPEQEAYFRKATGTARFAYNWGLAQWQAYRAEHPGEAHGVMAVKKDLNAIKRLAFPWMLEVAKDVVENALRHLGQALKNYYDAQKGERNGEEVGFPKFKSKKRSKLAFGLNNDKFRVEGYWIRIPKLGWVNLAEPLRFAGKILGAVVAKDADWWYVSIQVEMADPEPIEFPKESVGIDLGVKTLATLSDGRQYENQGLLRRQLRKLKRLNRELARRQKGSHRWVRTQQKLARFHKQVRDRRADILHKMTTQIARTYRLIGVEDLNVQGLVKNRRLALSIADAGMGEVLHQLTYKSAQFGGRVQRVGRFYASSKTCSACGAVNHELVLKERRWVCPGCGTVHERDFNASVNIEQEALRLVAA